MIYIYTETFHAWAKFKRLIKNFLGRSFGGPQAVELSLMLGLKQKKENVTWNKNPKQLPAMACVLSGVKTVRWAIREKQAGKICKIIVGPNIVISPNDFGGILKAPLIDKVIVPSLWVKEFYIKVASELVNKVEIWPAGVDVPEPNLKQKDIEYLVYKKNCPENLFLNIIDHLKKNKFTYKVLIYGDFKKEVYFSLLGRSKYLIYLSASESQGIAMFEAWARNVPTIVWEPGEYEREGVRVLGLVACPYLNENLGMSFLNQEEFILILKNISQKKFQPNKFVLENYTNKICAENFLKIFHA